MIAISRFDVPEDRADDFRARAEHAVAVLSGRPGLLSLDLAQNLEERRLWTLTTRWRDVGSYRRALGGLDGKAVVAPLLAEAIFEPGAYTDPDELGPLGARGD